MAFDFFRAISPLEIRIRKRRAGEVIFDPRTDGEWVMTYSSPRVSSTFPRNAFTGVNDRRCNGSEMPNRCQNGNGSFVGTTR